jgi:hypothetical protein
MPGLLSTLEQTEMWYGQDGFPYKVDEMETSHLRNTIAFLQRRAHNLYERHKWHEHRMFANAPDEVYNEYMHEMSRSIESNPVEWLGQRPLIQKMIQLVKLRESVTVEPLQLGGPNGGVMVRRD